MENIELKKEEAAFYFNQAVVNLTGLHPVIEKYQEQLESKKSNIKDNAINTIIGNNDCLKKLEFYIFNSKNVAQDAKGEIKRLLSKLIELRHFYSHYVHTDNVKELSNGEKSLLERYYQIAIEATGSEGVKLEITENNNRLTDAGVLFFLCMFLKKSQANKLISGISGFKRNDPTGQPRRNLFTHFSVREGYKVVPDMQKHFLLFSLVNHLSNQDKYIQGLQPDREISKGLFFHRMASKFLNISGILSNMKFYPYPSKRLKEQRGELKREEDSFEWIEPFQGNSYFSLTEHKGVIGEDELKELCYALLAARKDSNAAEGKIKQFLIKFKSVYNEQQVKDDEILKQEYFPANYFNQPKREGIKKKILDRLDNEIRSCSAKAEKAYDKMKEVMEFINNSLPSDEKLKQKDYGRYLKMVRFWGREKDNMKREFETKGWSKYFSSDFWMAKNLEEAYKLSRQKNAELYNKLKAVVDRMNEHELKKYQRISDAKDLASLKRLAQDLGVKWEEKDWEEYSRQIKKHINDMQKLTIMKQRVTAELKKKHGIENLNLRITIDSNKSRKAVLNRIAIPRGFVREHILRWQESEKVSKKIREAECKILLSKKYEDLSGQFYKSKNYDKLTQINGLYEKNKLIALMAIYLMEGLNIRLDEHTELDALKKQEVEFKLSDKVTGKIPLSQYSSLTYAISREYINKVNEYKFRSDEKQKPPETILDKIKTIEKERMEFIREVLGFEEYLFENNIINKSKFSDTATHISFKEICDELGENGFDKEKLTKLNNLRNAALHGEIPVGTSFDEAKLLINELKK